MVVPSSLPGPANHRVRYQEDEFTEQSGTIYTDHSYSVMTPLYTMNGWFREPPIPRVDMSFSQGSGDSDSSFSDDDDMVSLTEDWQSNEDISTIEGITATPSIFDGISTLNSETRPNRRGDQNSDFDFVDGEYLHVHTSTASVFPRQAMHRLPRLLENSSMRKVRSFTSEVTILENMRSKSASSLVLQEHCPIVETTRDPPLRSEEVKESAISAPSVFGRSESQIEATKEEKEDRTFGMRSSLEKRAPEMDVRDPVEEGIEITAEDFLEIFTSIKAAPSEDMITFSIEVQGRRRKEKDPHEVDLKYIQRTTSGHNSEGRSDDERPCMAKDRAILPLQQGYEIAPSKTQKVRQHARLSAWAAVDGVPLKKEDRKKMKFANPFRSSLQTSLGSRNGHTGVGVLKAGGACSHRSRAELLDSKDRTIRQIEEREINIGNGEGQSGRVGLAPMEEKIEASSCAIKTKERSCIPLVLSKAAPGTKDKSVSHGTSQMRSFAGNSMGIPSALPNPGKKIFETHRRSESKNRYGQEKIKAMIPAILPLPIPTTPSNNRCREMDEQRWLEDSAKTSKKLCGSQESSKLPVFSNLFATLSISSHDVEHSLRPVSCDLPSRSLQVSVPQPKSILKSKLKTIACKSTRLATTSDNGSRQPPIHSPGKPDQAGSDVSFIAFSKSSSKPLPFVLPKNGAFSAGSPSTTPVHSVEITPHKDRNSFRLFGHKRRRKIQNGKDFRNIVTQIKAEKLIARVHGDIPRHQQSLNLEDGRISKEGRRPWTKSRTANPPFNEIGALDGRRPSLADVSAGTSTAISHVLQRTCSSAFSSCFPNIIFFP